MQNKPTIPTKIIVLALALSIALSVFILSVSLASYTNSRHAQRTIATYEKVTSRFSSNQLAALPSRSNVKTVPVGNLLSSAHAVINICNYEQGVLTQPNEENISYVITVRLVKYDASTEEKYVPADTAFITGLGEANGPFTVTIQKHGDVSSVTLNKNNVADTLTLSGTLTGRTDSSDVYDVNFSRAFTSSDLYLEMIASATSGGFSPLRGIFKAEVRTAGAARTWTGSFDEEDDLSAPAPYLCDGYNYTVSGTGSGTCVLSWDDDKIAIHEDVLCDLLAISGATSTANSVTFAVDSNEQSEYKIRFAKISVGVGDDWEDLGVELSFTSD